MTLHGELISYADLSARIAVSNAAVAGMAGREEESERQRDLANRLRRGIEVLRLDEVNHDASDGADSETSAAAGGCVL